MKMKINFLNFGNNTIGGINKLQERIESLQGNYSENSEEAYICEELSDIICNEFAATDVGFTCMAAHLEDIANRAIEINDEVILNSLKSMHIISEGKDD